jgi:hypothetical protein
LVPLRRAEHHIGMHSTATMSPATSKLQCDGPHGALVMER